MILTKETLSQLFVKSNDYGTEEWAKQLLQNVTSKKLDNVNAFAGVIKFPSDDFLDHQLNQHQTTQFQNSVYVGYMDMLLPDLDGTGNTLSFSRLTFNLDGVKRLYVQTNTSVLTSDADKTAFKNKILTENPGANADIVFSRNCMHYLTDIQLSGSVYTQSGSTFTPVTTGSFTPSIEFEFLVSGYKCLLL